MHVRRLHKIWVSALFGLLTVAMLLLLRIVVKLWPRTYKSKDLVDDMHWHIYHVSQLKVHAYTFAARFVVAKIVMACKVPQFCLSIAFPVVTRNTM